MRSLFPRKEPPIDELWQWFKINHRRLEGASATDEQAFRQLSNLFRRIDRNMTYDVRHDDQWELQVSADGIPELIPMVREVVDKAPRLEGWQVSAFRKPKDRPATITAYDQVFNSDTVRYTLEQGKRLTLYIPGLTEENYRHLSHCAVIIVESLIGEYPLMTQIEELDYAELPEPAPAQLRPLSELPNQLAL